MAARRLLVVMLVLLGVSTLAAALVPPQTNDDETESTASEPTVPVETVPKGEVLRAKIVVGGEKTPVVPIRVGDQLELVVSSELTDLLEIPALGLIKAVAPEAPARFDILALEPRSYGIRFVDQDRIVARIEVKQEKDSSGKDEPSKKGSSEKD